MTTRLCIYMLEVRLNGHWKAQGGYGRLRDARRAIRKARKYAQVNHCAGYKPAEFRLLKETTVTTRKVSLWPLTRE